jgi:tetratricopeptide (TPR) repeat protein
MATISEAFDLAVRHHRSGNLEQAETLYRQVIQADAAHAAAHNMLGLLAYQTGRHEAAAVLIRRAIALRPLDAGCHFNLGVVLRKQGLLDEAGQCFRQVLLLEPLNAQAHCNLGNVCKDQGLMGEAAKCFRQAVAAEPHHADAYNNLGIILNSQGQPAEAAVCYRQALGINPRHAVAHHNLGITLMQLGQPAAAVESYRQALACNPSLADAHLNLGNALKELGQSAEAIAGYRQALRINPQLADAHNNLGNALQDQGEITEAIACYRQALRINPRLADPHHNLSIALREHALPLEDGARLNLFQEAREHNEQALQLDPGHAAARWHRALLRLREGDFEGGWRDYEQRWTQPGFVPRHLDRPRWDGSFLEGKTILVYAEQGLGDTIQFVRYIPLVQERGGKVLFECQPALAGLLADVDGVDELSVQGKRLPPYEMQVPLLSLPAIFGTTLATVPAPVPYLRADAARVEYWKKELAPLGGFKVGIAWQGSPKNPVDRYRSLPLAQFDTLARMEGVALLSLQVGPGMDQLAAANFPITDLGIKLDPNCLGDLAAVLKNVDLVITVDTAVAHLAGALGVRVWNLLPLIPDWRWLRERADSPWYPSMRLFRQSRFGDWGAVLEQVKEEIHLLIAGATGWFRFPRDQG